MMESTIRFPIEVTWCRRTRCWLGIVPALGVLTAARTREAAVRATDSAADMFIAVCLRRGINPLRRRTARASAS